VAAPSTAVRTSRVGSATADLPSAKVNAFEARWSAGLCCGGGPLAQLAEQWTFNPLVEGSSPSRPTSRDREDSGYLRFRVLVGLSRPGHSHFWRYGGARPAPRSTAVFRARCLRRTVMLSPVEGNGCGTVIRYGQAVLLAPRALRHPRVCRRRMPRAMWIVDPVTGISALLHGEIRSPCLR
jgi:hypothetical protein